MTWSARISDGEGNFPDGGWQACDTCRHGVRNTSAGMPCNLPKLSPNIGPMLTSIDVGADGHMAGGFAHLKCFGYEPVLKVGE